MAPVNINSEAGRAALSNFLKNWAAKNQDLSRKSIEGYNDVKDYAQNEGWKVGMREHDDPQVRNLSDAMATQGIREGERAAAGAIAQGGAGAGARAGMMRMAGASGGYQAGQQMALDQRRWLTGLDERNTGRRLEGAQQLFMNDFARHQHNEAKRRAAAQQQMQMAQLQNMMNQQKQQQQMMQDYLALAGNKPKDISPFVASPGYNAALKEWEEKMKAYEKIL